MHLLYSDMYIEYEKSAPTGSHWAMVFTEEASRDVLFFKDGQFRALQSEK